MYKGKRQKRIKFVFIFTVVGVLLLIGLMIFTPLGNTIIKKIAESKIDKYIPKAKVTYLEYNFNNFSLTARKGDNDFKIYGEIMPFNAMFEGNIKNLKELLPSYRGKADVKGKIFTKNGDYIVEGIAFFADGYMNFKAKLNNGIGFSGNGKDFDVKKLLYMLEINYPWVQGKTDLLLNGTNSKINAVFKTKGIYKKKLSTSFKAVTQVNIKHKGSLHFYSNIDLSMGNIKLNGKIYNGNCNYEFNASHIDLFKLKPVLLYPFRQYVDLKGEYDSSNDAWKFKGENFEGFISSKTEITFNMNSKKFFNYIGLSKFIKSSMSGTVKINSESGTFDIVSNNTKFLQNDLLKKIKHLTGIDLTKENPKKIFFKGSFDKNHLVFDMLSTNEKISLNVKKGEFVYPDQYNIVLNLRKNNDIFKILLKNNQIKILKHKNLQKGSNDILVY